MRELWILTGFFVTVMMGTGLAGYAVAAKARSGKH
jgi:hypothetical protein